MKLPEPGCNCSVGADAHIGPEPVAYFVGSTPVEADCISALAAVLHAPSPNAPNPMAACGHAALRPQWSFECFVLGGGRADVGIGPYEKGP